MELAEYVTGVGTFMIAGFFVASMCVLTAKPLGEAIKNEAIWMQLVISLIYFVVFTFVMYVLFT